MKLPKDIEVVNAEIISTKLGFEGHGIFTLFIGLRFESGNIGFGNFALDQWCDKEVKRTGSQLGIDVIMRIIKIAGVKNWEELEGQYIRINKVGLGESLTYIGHLVNDDWLNVKDILINFENKKG
ncbi:hypothetical protein P7H60_13495 [Vagococcus carniphilus]|uniref:hypothetical protein n=1 Tax=Vagococcus carniphilus TaxID=218144 RepID=UPI002890CB03|nr:hypothetical protein [Vagococcus carniphilus]MDT2850163.1 hypothetical protein [Vagococcus carniphilus]